MIPARPELIAGRLLNSPTVSWMPRESFPGSTVRSNQEEKFPSSVRSPAGKPGAEVNRMISQYPISIPQKQIICVLGPV